MQQINFAANTAAFWADSSLQELSIKSGFLLNTSSNRIGVSRDDYYLDPSSRWVKVLTSLGCTVYFDGKDIHITYMDYKNPSVYSYLGKVKNDWDYFNNLGHLFHDIEKFYYIR